MSLEDLSFEQRDEMALLLQELSNNPSTRKEVLRLTKKVRPDLNIPELEIEDKVENRASSAEERVQSLESKLREREALDDLKQRRESLIKKGLINNEEDISEVEKIMLEKKIADHETAAEYFQWMKQAAEPTPTGFNPQAMSKFNLAPYWKNPRAAAQSEAVKALAELRKNTKPIGI